MPTGPFLLALFAVAACALTAPAEAQQGRRAVPLTETHPAMVHLSYKPQTESDLAYLRQRYEQGRLDERSYFQFRRLATARDGDLAPPRALPRSKTRRS